MRKKCFQKSFSIEEKQPEASSNIKYANDAKITESYTLTQNSESESNDETI